MFSRFLFLKLAASYHLLHQGMILGDLTDVVADQIETAVSHIGHIEITAFDDSHYHGGPHASQIFILPRFLVYPAVGFLHCSTDDFDGIGLAALADALNQRPYRISRRGVTGSVASHSVCNHKEVRKITHRCLRGEHKILIHGPVLAYISDAKRLHISSSPLFFSI